MEITGILSLIFGIVGLIASYWYIGVLFCIVGLVLGIVGAVDCFSEKKLPVAGILISVLGIVMSVYFIVSDLDSMRLLVYADKFIKHEKVEEKDDFMKFKREGVEMEQEDVAAKTEETDKAEAGEENKEEKRTSPYWINDGTEETEIEEQKKTMEDNRKEQNKNRNVYKKGETANCNGLELTFLGYTESSGTEYNSPADGKVFVFPEFEVYNGTNEKVTMDTWTPFLYYCDGYNVESSSSAIFSMTELDLEVLTGDIVQGGRMRACLPLELPSDWKEMEIFYKDNYFGDTEFSFVFNK